MLLSLSLRFHWNKTVSDICHGKDSGEEDCPKARELYMFLEDKWMGFVMHAAVKKKA